MAIEFRDIKLEYKEDISSILSEAKTNNFSQTFGSYFLWASENKTKICIDDGVLYVKYDFEKPKYEMPKGAKNNLELKSVLSLIFEYAQKLSNKADLKFIHLTSDEVKKLEELFPNKFEITPVRSDYEYIYPVDDLANLKGKKYHSKRNHISKFSKKYDWKYEPLDITQSDKYFRFFDEWFKSKNDVNPHEQLAINKALKFYRELSMDGGTVVVGDKIVACTIGEKLNDDTFLVHFEKALPKFAEAYAVINNQFSKRIAKQGYKFINREEDLGIEGLRKAKLSYHPCRLIEKYEARIKNIEFLR